jgi:hypothetical protein
MESLFTSLIESKLLDQKKFNDLCWMNFMRQVVSVIEVGPDKHANCTFCKSFQHYSISSQVTAKDVCSLVQRLFKFRHKVLYTNHGPCQWENFDSINNIKSYNTLIDLLTDFIPILRIIHIDSNSVNDLLCLQELLQPIENKFDILKFFLNSFFLIPHLCI